MKPPFEYNPQTGEVIWKYRPDMPNNINARLAGKPAGYVNFEGYRWLEWKEGGARIRHSAAAVIWFMMTGEWPALEVDHVNRDPLDNRWENLRLATRSEQIQNRVRKRRGQPLPTGVVKRGNRFYAAIQADRKWRYLGAFATAEAAHGVYLEARERLHSRRPE